MNIFTHIAIGVRTKRAVEDILPIKLKTFPFLLGSIRPDLSLSSNKLPHYKNESIDFVMGEIKRLLSTGSDEYLENESKYAERLGILTHFISDYFCYAHSEKYKGGILKHYHYETKLMFYCAVRFRKIYSHDSYIAQETEQGFHEISIFLNDLLDKYSNLSACASLVDDMKYTHEACLALCIAVLTPRAEIAVNRERKLAKALV